ncbi:MAG: hypothetical protein CEE40_09545 [Chloroflexi bacterium B3_Chlor]|nr:MAG: hypothetical protein CEE40_09545 [Chloroflexi bacterium B3_Chlor]
MEEMIAYCGIRCTECPAYLATRNDDDEERKRVAEMWSKQFGGDIRPEDIVCDGCLPGHTQYFSYCFKCEIRACGLARGVVNCAHCDNYACDKLTLTFEMVPEAKGKLDEIRAGL